MTIEGTEDEDPFAPTQQIPESVYTPTDVELFRRADVLKLYADGMTDIMHIVKELGVRPSYVAAVLQESGVSLSYDDLYTVSGQNVYTRFFQGVVKFKTVGEAEASVLKLDRLYKYFARLGDRAGQHQSMVMALTGKNRARWAGHIEASHVFHDWLVGVE